MRPLFSLAAFGLVSLTCVCCSDSDDKHVAGRTRSISSVSSVSDSTRVGPADLRLTRERDQATGLERGRGRVSLAAVTSEAILRLPDGRELKLGGEPGQLAAEWEAELVDGAARLLPGGYTLFWREADGTVRSLELLLEGAPPAYPEVLTPADMSLVDPGALQVSWEWEGTGGLFDLELRDALDDALLAAERDLPADEPPTLDPHQLGGSGRYRLRVVATSGPAQASARWESASVVLFDWAR